MTYYFFALESSPLYAIIVKQEPLRGRNGEELEGADLASLFAILNALFDQNVGGSLKDFDTWLKDMHALGEAGSRDFSGTWLGRRVVGEYLGRVVREFNP